MPKRFIEINHSFVGFHKFEKASEMSKSISFLENLHRHLFYVTYQIEVSHSDRELEFFLLKDKLKSICDALEKNIMNVESACSWSCEMVAEYIKEFMNELYPETKKRMTTIRVSEDNESAGLLIWMEGE